LAFNGFQNELLNELKQKFENNSDSVIKYFVIKGASPSGMGNQFTIFSIPNSICENLGRMGREL